ncbi:hypothetical protein U1Q18_010033 [Sarracenia purpurea var. burkii]
MKRTNEDVVSIHAITRTDDVRTPFEPMDMFDLGMEYSNDGDIDGADNESGEKGGDNESGEGIHAEGEDNEQNKDINDEETASLRNKLETLQQANTKLELECGGLILAIE